MSLSHVEYVALADWMWQGNGWIVREIAFAKVRDTDETMVLLPTPESLGSFTFQDIQKNRDVHPLNGFRYEQVVGKEIRVDLDKLEAYIESELKNMVIGTFDMATFLYLEPLLKGNMKYLGERMHAEEDVVDQIHEHKRRYLKQN